MKINSNHSLLLLAVVAGIVATLPAAYAAEVGVPLGTSVPGCEETNECWDPAEITVGVGETVTWSNDDTAAHTVTSGSVDEGGPDGNFDSSLFMAGTTFEWTPDAEGEYPYFCMVHPWMAGMVIVGAGDGESMEGDIVVMITSDPVGKGKKMTVNVEIMGMDGNMGEHVNYNVKATQNGKVVLDDKGVHDHDGSMDHKTMELPAAASGDNPVDVEVEFLGFGLPDDDPSTWTGPIGEMSTTQVVPEFGTIAVMILGVAIISIIAVTARSKVIPRL